LIFFTCGEIVKELVPGHTAYAEKFGIWNRGDNRAMKPLLDKYWLPYLRGRGTFEEAIAAILGDAP
jgi:hypothetical protein